MLAVVAGDGTGARVFAQPVRAVAPAWRPGAPHTLAWVDASGRVEVRDVDSGALVWRSRGERRRGDAHWRGRPTAIACWRAAPSASSSSTSTGKRAWRVRLPAGARSARRRGRRAATGSRSRCARATATSVYVTPSARVPRRPVFTTTGTLRSLAWSPNGRRLLVRWAEADQWLLLSPGTAHAPITAIGSISRRFGSRARPCRAGAAR